MGQIINSIRKNGAGKRRLRYRRFQCPGQLIRTGGAPPAAVDAFQTGYHFLNLHALHQLGNSLGVPVTSSDELYMMDSALIDFKCNRL